MKRRTLQALLLTLVLVPTHLSAQEVIDIFDDQASMPAAEVSVDGDARGATIEDLGLTGERAPDGAVRLKFERADSSILVEVEIQGKDAYLIFDTGASITALNTAFVKSVGKLPGSDAPRATVSTANGPAIAAFGLLDNLTLGGRAHSGVSFMTCDACPFGVRDGRPIVGLLGLNVLNRYRYSIDESTGTIELLPTSSFSNRMRDVQPWLKIAGGRGAPAPASKTEVTFEVQNLAPRSVREVVFSVECSSGASARLEPVSVTGRQTKSVKQVVDIETCGRASIRPLAAVW